MNKRKNNKKEKTNKQQNKQDQKQHIIAPVYITGGVAIKQLL